MKASELSTAVRRVLNDFINANDGRAPRMIELAPTDWQALRDQIQTGREAEGFPIYRVDLTKTDGRENFRLFGMTIVPAVEEIVGPRAIAS